MARLTNPDISVLINLHTIHGGHFVHPMLLMRGRCTQKEYALAVFAGSPDIVRVEGYRPLGGLLSMPVDEDDDEESDEYMKRIIRGYEVDAEIALAYIKAMA